MTPSDAAWSCLSAGNGARKAVRGRILRKASRRALLQIAKQRKPAELTLCWIVANKAAPNLHGRSGFDQARANEPSSRAGYLQCPAAPAPNASPTSGRGEFPRMFSHSGAPASGLRSRWSAAASARPLIHRLAGPDLGCCFGAPRDAIQPIARSAARPGRQLAQGRLPRREPVVLRQAHLCLETQRGRQSG
jgi:hypothetical protein